MKKLFTIKKIILTFAVLTLIAIGIIIICNAIINKTTKEQVYNDVNLIPHNKIGVILGTSKYLSSGQLNLYFAYRIDAAVELYKAGKVDFFVVSGDNSRKDYNEPLDMKNELVRRGVPENKIFLDYAGFRTYDSVIRMDKIFGQTDFTIISQEFHNQRAVYIANRLGLNAVGFNAKDVDVYNGFKTKVREKFARVKVFVDFVFGKEPRFLGEEIEIG
jgi:SanA protein